MADKSFEEIKPEYCCIDLFRATESEILNEVVSGIRFMGQTIFLNYCPFCGARITSMIRTEKNWTWKTKKLKESQ